MLGIVQGCGWGSRCPGAGEKHLLPPFLLGVRRPGIDHPSAAGTDLPSLSLPLSPTFTLNTHTHTQTHGVSFYFLSFYFFFQCYTINIVFTDIYKERHLCSTLCICGGRAYSIICKRAQPYFSLIWAEGRGGETYGGKGEKH